ncbi:MAG: hypothetical protein ACPLSK_06705, partial [bacterium]
SGGIPLSLGAFFTGTIARPTCLDDKVNFTNNPPIGRVEYWVIGPGTTSGSDTLPPSIKTSEIDAWGLSITFYILFPLLGAVSGSLSFLNKANETWRVIKASKELISYIKDTMKPQDLASLIRALTNALVEIFTICGEEILIDLGISAVPPVFIVKKIIDILFGAINVTIAANYWLNCPGVAKVEVYATGGADAVIK